MMRRTFTVLAAALVVVAAGCADPAPSAVRASAAVTSTAPLVTSDVTAAEVVSPDPRVGAVFLDGQSLHVCSGAVLDSPAGDLILTAAHCVADGMEAYFVPGFAGKADPADYWRLDAVYLDPRWLYTQDPLADFAIARVSRASGGSVQAQVGSGYKVGSAPKDGTEVTVSGYALGVGGEQLGCRAQAGTHEGFPALPCVGLVDGTSGSPWIADGVITGVVGGLNGGGCEQDMSYSPPFDDAIVALLHRAEAGGAGDTAPTAMEDDC